MLAEREKEIGSVRAALQAREAVLSQELAQARAREQDALKAGRKVEAESAARSRWNLENRQKALKGELLTREKDLEAAKADAQRNAAARKQAQSQADQLRRELAEREKTLALLRKSKDTKQVQDAERQVAEARAQLQGELAARDKQLAEMQKLQEARLREAQVAARLQADELNRAKEQLVRTEQKLAAQSQQAVAERDRTEKKLAAQSQLAALERDRAEKKLAAQAQLAAVERDRTEKKLAAQSQLAALERDRAEKKLAAQAQLAAVERDRAEKMAVALQEREQELKLQQGHERELAKAKQEREVQAKQAQERAARVEGLLKERETELKRLQDEMRVREATLAAELDDAKTREADAKASGQAADAKKAAQERQTIEGAMAKLQADLKARELALTSATREVKEQAVAREKAEQEVERLSKALADREAALASARKQNPQVVAAAEKKVAEARDQHTAALATRDADIRRLEQQAEARVAQVRAELAAEHKKREEALTRQYQDEMAAEKAERAQSDRAAAQKAEQMNALLQRRESEMNKLKAEVQARVAHLDDELAVAKQREQAAQKSGRKTEAAAAGRELKAVQREVEVARKAMQARDAEIAAARQEAVAEQKARAQAERKAAALTQALAVRAAELKAVQADRQSQTRIAAAQRAVAEARRNVETAERQTAAQQKKTAERIEKEIAQVRVQLQAEHEAREKAMQERFASRERELEGALAAEQSRRKQAEQTATAKGGEDFLKKQQARIAVLESRAEKEQKARAETDARAEQERLRVAELEARLESERAEKLRQTKELESARRQAQQASAEASRVKQQDTARRQSQDEDRTLRKDAEQERARSRSSREGTAEAVLQVRDIAITSEGKRRGRVEVPLSGMTDSSHVEIIARTDSRVVLRIVGVRLPERLQRAFDTRALQGPLERVTAFQAEGARDEMRIAVDLLSPSTDRVVVRGDKLVWDFDRVDAQVADSGAAGRPKSAAVKSGGDVLAATPQPAMAPQGDEATGGGSASAPEGANYDPIRAPWRKSRRYTGKRINLTIKDADIQHVLTFLAKEGKVNIIAGPEVTGKVTFHLENIPWDLALDVILRARSLDYVRQSGVIRVSTLENLKKEFESEIDRKQKSDAIKPMVVRIVPINYGDAQSMVVQAKDLLSQNGKASVDLRTNSIVVKDTEEHVAAVEEMIRKLDAQTPQVLIEARVVEASSQFTRDIGVQWGGNFAASSVFGNETGLRFPSVVGVGGGADGGTPDTHGVAVGIPNYAVNMPAAVGAGSGGALGLTLGSLGGAANLNLRLSAAEQEGVVKVVSSPKVLTLNNTTATIKQGIQIPISVVSAQGVQTRFFNADLKLQATPHITQDGNIKMNVQITKNEPDFSNRAADGNPTIASREAATDLLLGDGETTVIGGIYTRTTSTSTKKVPFFGDIPLLGFFFRNKNETDKRSELLIFITPRIVNRAASMSVGK